MRIAAVTVDVRVLDDNVTEVDAYPKYNPLFLGRRSVALGHSTLHSDRADHRLNDAGELDQDAIAGQFDDPAMLCCDLGLDQFRLVLLKALQGADIISPHQAAVADDVGGEDGG